MIFNLYQLTCIYRNLHKRFERWKAQYTYIQSVMPVKTEFFLSLLLQQVLHTLHGWVAKFIETSLDIQERKQKQSRSQITLLEFYRLKFAVI